MTDPIALFQEWLDAAIADTSLRQPRAFCLSTVDSAGAPDARFVDLKEATQRGFVFGTHLDSPKAAHIVRDPRVAMTFWWDHIGRQVRITGIAHAVSDGQADAMFRERSRAGQVVAAVSVQSRPLRDPGVLEAAYTAAYDAAGDGTIARPARWSGFCIRPDRIEFLTFSSSRMHERVLYVRDGDSWTTMRLQP